MYLFKAKPLKSSVKHIDMQNNLSNEFFNGEHDIKYTALEKKIRI